MSRMRHFPSNLGRHRHAKVQQTAGETREAHVSNEVGDMSLAEPISPELALVDPELARRARAEFPPPPLARAVGSAEASDAEASDAEASHSAPLGANAAPAAPSEAETPGAAPSAGRKRWPRVLRIFGAVSFLALA